MRCVITCYNSSYGRINMNGMKMMENKFSFIVSVAAKRLELFPGYCNWDPIGWNRRKRALDWKKLALPKRYSLMLIYIFHHFQNCFYVCYIGDEQCNSTVLFRSNWKARWYGTKAVKQRSVDTKNGIVCYWTVSECKLYLPQKLERINRFRPQHNHWPFSRQNFYLWSVMDVQQLIQLSHVRWQ